MNNFSVVPFLFLLGLSCVSGSAVPDSPLAPALQAFDRSWKTAKDNIFPKSLSLMFTPEKYSELRASLSKTSSLEDVVRALNPFFKSLSISHTAFMTDQDLDYWFLKSLFHARDPDLPKFFHLGCQFKEIKSGWWVRAVPEGTPAEKIGLRRGDVVTSFEGKPFHPIKSFTGWDPSKPGLLEWSRLTLKMSAPV
ncbi:MAG: hypothetical protein K2X47_04125, partial [Bdellovibrionales bacterium]|nr:hypothetical protein [Bdellovibrionales bacterium]